MKPSAYAACGKCGGTARETLRLADRETPVCMSCQSDVATLLNDWLGRRQDAPTVKENADPVTETVDRNCFMFV